MNRKLLITVIALASVRLAPAQSASPTAESLLRASWAAQTKTQVQDVVLTGLVTSGPESNQETVPFTFKASANGGSRTEIDSSDGRIVTIRNKNANGSTGWWSRDGGTSHQMAGHNVLNDSAWYFPLLVIQRLVVDKTSTVSYMGLSSGLAHFRIHAGTGIALSQSAAARMAHLTRMDLYLDPTTLLPARLDFNLHPDNNALVDIPISSQYSEYQELNGIRVPMHIQRTVNNMPALDIHVQDAAFNTGLTQGDFNAQ